MSHKAKILPVLLTVLSATAQAQTTPYTSNVVEDPSTGKYIKTNVVVVPELVETHFGDKGVWVLGGGTAADISGQHQDSNGITADAFEAGLTLVAGRFVAKDLLLGMQGGIDAVLNNGGEKTLLVQRVGPLIGYNVRMTEHSSFLPSLAVMYDYEQTWATGGVGSHEHVIELEANLGFSLNLSRHINVLVGPYVAQSVYNHVNASSGLLTSADASSEGPYVTTYGLKASVLGWL